MVIEKIQKLQELQARATELQAQVEEERTQELRTLPAQYGYDTLPAFIKALKSAATSGARRRSASGRVAKTKKVAKSGTRKRAKITPEMKEDVRKAVEAGKTGAQIGKELGISLPSVQNIKKELGLVKARKA